MSACEIKRNKKNEYCFDISFTLTEGEFLALMYSVLERKTAVSVDVLGYLKEGMRKAVETCPCMKKYLEELSEDEE